MYLSRADLELVQGDTASWTVTVTNEDGTPADISTYTAQAQIRRAVADADEVVVADMTTLVESPAVVLALTSAQTTPMSGFYVWDLQLTGSEGEIITIMAGRVKVTAEVTRAVA